MGLGVSPLWAGSFAPVDPASRDNSLDSLLPICRAEFGAHCR